MPVHSPQLTMDTRASRSSAEPMGMTLDDHALHATRKIYMVLKYTVE